MQSGDDEGGNVSDDGGFRCFSLSLVVPLSLAFGVCFCARSFEDAVSARSRARGPLRREKESVCFLEALTVACSKSREAKRRVNCQALLFFSPARPHKSRERSKRTRKTDAPLSLFPAASLIAAASPFAFLASRSPADMGRSRGGKEGSRKRATREEGARGEIAEKKKKEGSIENSTSTTLEQKKNKKRRPLPLPSASPRLFAAPSCRPPGPSSPGAPAAAPGGSRRRARVHARAGDGPGEFSFFSFSFFFSGPF